MVQSAYTSWLSGLTLLNVHRDISVDIEAAIDEFPRRHSRRTSLVEILHTRWINSMSLLFIVFIHMHKSALFAQYSRTCMYSGVLSFVDFVLFSVFLHYVQCFPQNGITGRLAPFLLHRPPYTAAATLKRQYRHAFPWRTWARHVASTQVRLRQRRANAPYTVRPS